VRSFTDAAGRPWQAALLDASYGGVAVVFSPLQGEGHRTCPLAAAHLAEAMTVFAALDDAGLRRLLAAAAADDDQPATA